jgi:hypothetical protein
LAGGCISNGWKYSINSFEQFFESRRKRKLNWFGINFDGSRSYITEDHEVIFEKYVKEGVILNLDVC